MTNLKTKNNQNCQKIKLYGSPKSEELKKHSSRQVGRAQMGSQRGEGSQQGGGWRSGTAKVAAGGPGSPTFACR